MPFPCAADFATAADGDSAIAAIARELFVFLDSVHGEAPALLAAKEAELAKLACQFLAGQEDVSTLEEQVARLRADLRKSQRELAALTVDVAGLRADNAKLHAGLASLTRPRDLLWMHEAAATIFHTIATDVMGWDEAARAAARVDTLAQLRAAIKEREDSSERGAALEWRLEELGLTPACEEAVSRVKRLGNAAAHCDLSEGGELSNADICATFEAKAAAVLPATAVSPRASGSPTRVTADDGREVARLLRLVLLPVGEAH
jgi:hypothetical protein